MAISLTKAQERLLNHAREHGHSRLRGANDRRAADALEREGLGYRDHGVFYPTALPRIAVDPDNPAHEVELSDPT